MLNNIRLKSIALFVCSSFSGAALASGFMLFEQDGSGIGNALAGSAAKAENAASIFYNPAGMTRLRDREFSLGVTNFQPSLKFSGNGSPFSSLSGDGGDGAKQGFLPDIYLAWKLGKDFHLGLGVNAPYGLMTDYKRPWIGGAQSEKFSLTTYNVNPSVAWRASETVSVGLGVSWLRLSAKYARRAGAFDVPTNAGTLYLSRVETEMNASGDGWGWNAGILVSPTPATKIGLSYRSAVKIDTSGNIALGNDGTLAGIASQAYLDSIGSAGASRASIKLPDSLILSATHQFNERWEGLADVSWTGWGSMQGIDITYKQTGQVAQTLGTRFRDTWRIALGANYQVNDRWKLRAGLAYDQTPVKGAETRLVAMPDNNRTWLSLSVSGILCKRVLG